MVTKMNTDNIILHSHTGLGDQFVISGLVRSFFVNRYKKIYIATSPLKTNLPTLSKLYEDLPQIEFVDVEMGDDVGHTHVYNLSLQLDCPIFKLGFKWMWHHNTNIKFPGDMNRYIQGKNSIFDDKLEYIWPDPEYSYPKKFYSYLDQPYKNRYKYFKLPTISDKLYNKLYTGEKYVLIHNSASDWIHTHLEIPTEYKKIYVEPISDNLLDWVPLIENAEEIHCVDSSVFHLVDNMSHSLRAKLFYHDSRRNGATGNPNYTENNNVWNIVKYDNRFPPEDYFNKC